MSISPFDSTLYRDLWNDAEIAWRFGDAAELDSMMRVEAALASAQAELGLIPTESADAIVSAINSLSIDAAGLSSTTAADGVPVPAMLSAIRAEINNPDNEQYLHWGATSQDIIDTALILRLREIGDLVGSRLQTLLTKLADFAQTHATTPMVARTRRQAATPTSFGLVIVGWGAPLLNALEALAQLKPRLLRVSLGGASGNANAFGERADELRAAFAAELGLANSDLSWHSDRSALVEFSSLLTRISGALAKIGEDCILGAQTEVGELTLLQSGGSSTMPHKANPVIAESLVTLFQLSSALNAAMQQALLHRQQRDGASWSLEWHALPQICMASGRALQLAHSLVSGLQPDVSRMLENVQGAYGLAFAEAVSFRLSEIMPRALAQQRVAELCAEAQRQQRGLQELVTSVYPAVDWGEVFAAENQLGDSEQQVAAFAARVGELG
ncbi:MAG: 3-carboxy-cis,cis-muconate cycloisomerase [Planctomycetota bacterium]|jgi:3-carboxy-cis,cis-muconate cycloisomerase